MILNRRKSIKFFSLILVGIIALLLSIFVPYWKTLLNQNQSEQVVKLAIVRSAFYLPLMVAHDQKFFSKYNLKSEIVLFNNVNDMLNSLLKGDTDVTALGSGGAFALESKFPKRIKFIYGQNNLSYSFVVPKNSLIKSLDDLKGKKIGTWPSPTSKVLLNLLLDDRIGKNSYQIIPIEHRFLNQTLKKGDVEALFNTDVFTQQAISLGDARYLSKLPLEEYVLKPFFNGGGLVDRNIINNNPRLFKAIQSVSDESISFIRSHNVEARKSLITHIGVSEEIASKSPVDRFLYIDEVDVVQAQKLSEIFQKRGVFSQKISVESMFR